MRIHLCILATGAGFGAFVVIHAEQSVRNSVPGLKGMAEKLRCHS